MSWGQGLAPVLGLLSEPQLYCPLFLVSLPQCGGSIPCPLRLLRMDYLFLPYRQTIVHAHLGLQIAFSMWQSLMISTCAVYAFFFFFKYIQPILGDG